MAVSGTILGHKNTSFVHMAPPKMLSGSPRAEREPEVRDAQPLAREQASGPEFVRPVNQRLLEVFPRKFREYKGQHH